MAALDDDLGLGSWEVAPTDGTEPLRSSDRALTPTDPDSETSVPLVLPDGSLVATLKARGAPVTGQRSKRYGRLAAVAGLLHAVLSARHDANRARQRAQAAEAAAVTDSLTGLPNRRAWRQALHVEEARGARTGSAVIVAVIDLRRTPRSRDLDVQAECHPNVCEVADATPRQSRPLPHAVRKITPSADE